MNTKVCNECGEEKPSTSEFYHKQAKSRDGLQTRCKPCRQRKDNIYKKTPKGRESHKIAQKRYQNTEKGGITTRRFLDGHPNYMTNHSKIWRDKKWITDPQHMIDLYAQLRTYSPHEIYLNINIDPEELKHAKIICKQVRNEVLKNVK